MITSELATQTRSAAVASGQRIKIVRCCGVWFRPKRLIATGTFPFADPSRRATIGVPRPNRMTSADQCVDVCNRLALGGVFERDPPDVGIRMIGTARVLISASDVEICHGISSFRTYNGERLARRTPAGKQRAGRERFTFLGWFFLCLNTTSTNRSDAGRTPSFTQLTGVLRTAQPRFRTISQL